MSRSAPSQVTLAYRVVGEAQTHVFTSEQAPGLHIGSSCPEQAFEDAIAALGEIVSHECGYQVVYQPVMTFEEFWSKVRTPLPAGESLLSKFVIVNKKAETKTEARV